MSRDLGKTPEHVSLDNYFLFPSISALRASCCPLTAASNGPLGRAATGSRAQDRLRKHTVEAVFGTVEEPMAFRRFLLPGLEKVEVEWAWVTLACHCKRSNDLRLA